MKILEKTDKRIEELTTMMGNTNAQHRKEMGFMKQNQTEIQEIKTDTESLFSRLNKGEDRMSDLEDRIVTSDHQKKDILKIEKIMKIQSNNYKMK